MTRVGQEIIDLTVSPPPPVLIVIDSDDENAESSNQPVTNGQEKKKKPRRKKQKKSRDGVVDTSNQASRAPSPEQDPSRGRRSRSPGGNDDNLFVVDVQPVPIQPSLKLPEPVEGLNVTESTLPNFTNSAKLLLPAHVSVSCPRADGVGPVDIIRLPNPDSKEEEDFIEYLDYDDGVKVSIINTLLNGMSFSKSAWCSTRELYVISTSTQMIQSLPDSCAKIVVPKGNTRVMNVQCRLCVVLVCIFLF